MSKILLRLFKFCHPAFFFYFNSFMLCKCFQSLSNNSFERVRPVIELQEDSSDFSNGENPGREEDLIADVLNGETLLFLTYKIDTREVADEICEVNKTHEVICNCDSGSPEDYSPNDADDEKFENTKTNDEEEKIEMQSEENELPRKRPKLEEKNDGESGEEIGMPRKQELDGKEGEKGDEERKDQFMAMVQYTAETTSKSSWEWRSSTNYRDSEMEDLYSSSSYSVDSLFIKKYDEEMLFYDKISAQKLQETESFRMMNPLPSSISKRIMINLRGYLEETQRLREDVRNPQQELEAAYVAQICLTWEALNWNYKNFKKLKAGKEDGDSGYYAHVAQQFQQFQVLLQRFIEVEPYERGRRPEIYARMRISRPKLLQVPELRVKASAEFCFLSELERQKLLSLINSLLKIRTMASHSPLFCFLCHN